MIAIDPGSEYSAFVEYVEEDSARRPLPLPKIITFGKVPNEQVIHFLKRGSGLRVVCEFPVPRGAYMDQRGKPRQTASTQLFETLWWIGRFNQVVSDNQGIFLRMDRKKVKIELCESISANDTQIRASLIDLYGGEAVAIGGHKCPVCGGRKGSGRGKERKPCQDCGATGKTPTGPLYGISSDVWQALGVAVTWNEQQKRSMK